MSNFVQEIYDFNQQAGLLDKPYYDILESSFQVEEALEGFDLRKLYAKLNGFGEDVTKVALSLDDFNISAKTVSRHILYDFIASDTEATSLRIDYLSDVERLDKAIDAIVFAVGSIAKLGLNVEQIHRAIGVVTEANLKKLSNIKVDSNGKLLKDSNFVGPEVKLQAILDERQ